MQQISEKGDISQQYIDT